MRLPVAWSRSRATALGVTLGLHAVAIWWLLALRFQLPEIRVEDLGLTWIPLPLTPPPPPVLAPDLPPTVVAPITAPQLPMPVTPVAPAAPADFSQSARSVAKDMAGAPSYPQVGETPGSAKNAYPPSIFEQPLPRVGKTVVTPDGETIIWVSDYCFVSISSRSIAFKELHEGRRGVKTCVLAQFGGDKKARSDLFDAIKRPPPPQEPGCNEEGAGKSCGR